MLDLGGATPLGFSDDTSVLSHGLGDPTPFDRASDTSWCSPIWSPCILLPVPLGCLHLVLRFSPKILPGGWLEVLEVAPWFVALLRFMSWHDLFLHCHSTIGSTHQGHHPSLGYPTPFDCAWSWLCRSSSLSYLALPSHGGRPLRC